MKHQIPLGHPNKIRSDDERSEFKQRAETDSAKRLKHANIPIRFHGSTWDDYQPTAGIKASGGYEETLLKDVLRQFVDEWQVGQAEGLVLCGDAGRGKTMGVALLARYLCLEGVWVKFITNVELGEMRKHMFGLNKDTDRADDSDAEFWTMYNRHERNLRQIEYECDLLILDDVGQEYRAASDWSASLLSQTLRRRGDLGKSTVITSNLTREGWKSYNSSLYSFLHEVGGGEVLEINFGADHRERPSRFRRRSSVAAR